MVGKIRTLHSYLQPIPMTSLPEDFLKSLDKLLSADEQNSLERALERVSPVSLRVNPEKWVEKFTDEECIPWCKTGRYLNERPIFALDPAFHVGSYYVQEAGSMLLERVWSQLTLPEQPLVLDLCASPGGKTTHLLSMLNHQGLLVSNEVIKSRSAALLENITKWGYANVMVSQNDPRDFTRLAGLFDVLVVDAPCSGEGMFRKDPMARSHWGTEQVEHCHLRQKRILQDAWPCLKEGGYLIYSTCTFNNTEDEQSLLHLIHQGGAEAVRLSELEWGIDHRLIDGLDSYRTWPHRSKAEGFFISAVRKTSAEKETKIRTSKRITKDNKMDRACLRSNADHLMILRDEYNKPYLFPEAFVSQSTYIAERIKLLKKGTTLGEEKGRDFQWSHDFAMSIHLAMDQFDILDLDIDQALNYLRKNALPTTEGSQKWVLASYQDLPLGWLKNAGNRLNNYYPKEWRLRLQ